ncbi:HET-domain-containing protein [Neurospora crassa]|uniref:Related to tol protein n=1 Tax=Neurospora crassa TaxID=5141 RepID=Q6MFN3_NEUCS|nr:HET-domain-containing protein [Neurospora crassa]CAE85556.1 related to tol protein [Neurospora crassa]
MAEIENLCEYCTAIDFEQLRLPSSKDVEELNEGQPIEGRFPWINYRINNDDRPHWSLGAQSRIERSASTCSFCREVSLVLETSGVRVKAPAVFEKDTICDVYFTEAGYVEAPAGVTWKRYDALEIPAIPYPRVSLRWTVREKHPWRWSWMGRYPGYKDVIELFEGFQSIEMGTNERQSLFNGRERPALIDLELPRRWLRHCLDNDDCCAKLKGEGVRTSVFRLIDTTSKSVVEFDQHRLGDIPYVTLSYVWGTTQQAMLKRENLLRLQLPGSLQGATPQTITDAMMFTSYMGYRYLWVDTLCIIQNDDADKMSQLQIMGDIYKNANFTIVAAAGENSGSGLAGILTPRRAIQRKVQVRPAGPQEMPLWLISTVMPRTGSSNRSYTHSLPWQTRGWTLQEISLSRRVFIFTGEQLLWSCRRCRRWEETDTETKFATLSWQPMEMVHVILSTSLGSTLSRRRDIEYQFWSLASDFSKRDLSFDGDAHDAFSAILREYTEMTGEQLLWGLPVSKEKFSRSLCWETTWRRLVRRECLTTLPTTSLQVKVSFPSWSWLGWKGDIQKQWRSASFLKLEIRPYVLRNTPVRLVEIYDIPEDNMSRTMPFSTNGGESASPLPTHSYPNAFEPLTLDTIYKTLSPDITPKRLSRTPDDQLLFFWCERTYLYLGKPSGDEDTISVHDEEGKYQFFHIQRWVLGHLDEEWERPKYSWKSDRMKVEFIAIASDACPWFALSSNPSQREKQGIEFFLFLIKRRQGIAYRVATIGFVSIEKWLKFKRERILVALG